jgi:pilus assembly protein CpaE
MVAQLLAKSTAQPKALVAFVTDAETKKQMADAISTAGIEDTQIVQATLADAIAKLQKMPTPDRLAVDVTGSVDPIADLMGLADVCDEGTSVIVIGDINDIELYRSLIGLGVDDYLVKPIAADALAAAIKRRDAGAGEEPGAKKLGRVISVVGARGGVGATSIAINLAWTIANEQKRRVALVDLDLFFGNCGLALDLELGRGFREALENPSRIDGLFIERAMLRDGDNLFILSSEEALDYVINFDPTAVELLIDHLRRDFDYVLVDLPRFAARSQTAMLTAPASVLVVSDPSLAGMRDTQRLVSLFKKIAPNADTSVGLNRVGEFKGGELSKGDFEKGAQAKADWVIPFDAKTFGQGSGAGKPLAKIDGKAKSTQLVRDMAKRLTASTARKPSDPGWKRWFSGAR